MPYATVDEAIEIIRQGQMIIIVDDEDRENEGDLVIAGPSITPEAINFMAMHGRGLICLAMSDEQIRRIRVPMMVDNNQAPLQTAFTVSIEAAKGVTTGISAADRAATVLAAINPKAEPEDIVSPGHIFPLRVEPGGVLRRAGHTEASVDMAQLAGAGNSAVICEIMNEDGTMARLGDLHDYALKHKLKIIKISDLIEYRLRTENLVERVSQHDVDTNCGKFKLHVYKSIDGKEHMALTHNIEDGQVYNEPVTIRVQAASLISDVFGIKADDQQVLIHDAMARIAKEGRGAIVYIRSEENPLGVDALRAKRSQDADESRPRAFLPYLRDYGTGAQIVRDLGIRQLRLITNSPRKIAGIDGYGLEVVERISIKD